MDVEQQRTIVLSMTKKSRQLRKKCNDTSLTQNLEDIKEHIAECRSLREKSSSHNALIVVGFCEKESLTWALRIRKISGQLHYKYSTISIRKQSRKHAKVWYPRYIPIASCSCEEITEFLGFIQSKVDLDVYISRISRDSAYYSYRFVDDSPYYYEYLLKGIEKTFNTSVESFSIFKRSAMQCCKKSVRSQRSIKTDFFHSSKRDSSENMFLERDVFKYGKEEEHSNKLESMVIRSLDFKIQGSHDPNILFYMSIDSNIQNPYLC